MDRKSEFDELKQKMSDSSKERLDSVEKRLNKRIIKNRIRVAVLTPVVAIFVLMCTFIGMVNVSPDFVYACSKLPVISDLANAVCVSESIKSMINNEYGTMLGESQTVNGIKVTMEQYVISNNNIYILVSVEAEEDMDLACLTKIKLLNGNVLTDGISNLTIKNNKGYFKISIEELRNDIYGVYDKENYVDKNMLNLDLNFGFVKLEDKEYHVGIDKFENSININFPIIIDMTKNIVNNEAIYFSKTIEIDGQMLTFANAYFNPGYISIDVFESESNNKTLDNLILYLKNGEGKEFNSRPNETYLSYINGREKKHTYYLETPYFDNNEQLDIYITRATFLSKDYERPYIDLENTENSILPEGTELVNVEKDNNNIKLSLSFINQSLQLHECFDENNNKYKVNTISNDGDNFSISTRELEIYNFNSNKIYFDLYNDTVVEFNEPIQINIR